MLHLTADMTSDSLAVPALLHLQVNLSLLSALEALGFLEPLEIQGHLQGQGYPSIQLGGHKSSRQDYLKDTKREVRNMWSSSGNHLGSSVL